MHTYVAIHAHTCAHECVFTCVHTHDCGRVWTCVCALDLHLCVDEHAGVLVCVHLCVHEYRCVRTVFLCAHV